MTPEVWVTWFGVAVSIVFSLLAWNQARAALRDTRAYKDAVFVLEWEPFEMDFSADPMANQGRVTLKLINKGESFARDVELKANFDPYGLVIPIGRWSHIAGGGASVLHPTLVDVTSHAALGLPSPNLTGGENLCSVAFTSQAGHRSTQLVPFPYPHQFAIHTDAQS